MASYNNSNRIQRYYKHCSYECYLICTVAYKIQTWTRFEPDFCDSLVQCNALPVDLSGQLWAGHHVLLNRMKSKLFSALDQSGLKTLNERLKKYVWILYLMYEVMVWSQLCSLLPANVNHPHGYGLPSGSISQSHPRVNTDRLRNFITYRYT